MMNVEAYREWMHLYSKDVEEIWSTERKELRRSAMILKILGQEFARIQDDFNSQLSQFRKQYDTFEKHKILLSPDTSIVDTSKNVDMDTAIETDKPNISDDSFDIISVKSSPNPLTIKSDISVLESSEDSVHTSPKLNKHKKYFSKRKLKFNSLDCTIAKSVEKKKPAVEKLGTPKQLLEDDDLINCTMIDGTPILNKNLKVRSFLEPSKKKTLRRFKKSSNNNTTLTQMFPNILSSTVNKSETKSADVTDETFCDNIEQSIPPDDNKNGNKNCDEAKPRREVICKEPVVRGKARQKLEGWDCEECGKFYEVLGVNTQERKRLQNKCSKHRANRQQLNDTPAGFWSLNFPPTEDTEQSCTSMYFQY